MAPAAGTQAASTGPGMPLTFAGTQVQEAVGALFSQEGSPWESWCPRQAVPTLSLRATQPLPNWQTDPRAGRRGHCLAPRKVPPALSSAWTVGPWACPTLRLPQPSTHSHLLPAQPWPLPRGPRARLSPLRPLAWGGGARDPVFPVPHHCQPLTHLLGIYLYPSHKCSAQRSRQASLCCWQPQDMWRGWARPNVPVDKPSPSGGRG